jgi:uncharacterized protein
MDTLWITLSSLGSGALVGFILGLIGSGGSIMATPLLLYVVGVSQPHVAIGTGALAVSANAFASFVGHARRGNVVWRCAAVFAIVGTLGALMGSTLGKSLRGELLLFLFGMVMIVVGISMLIPRREAPAAAQVATLGNCLRTAAAALAAGTAAGFFGIGGGFLIVPALILATGMSMAKAVGSSLLAVTALGLATALNYALSGLVDWTIAALFIAGGIGGGLLGTRLSLRLGQQKHTLSRLFAGIVFGVALYILHRNSGAVLGA